MTHSASYTASREDTYYPQSGCTCGRTFIKDTPANANVALGVHVQMANKRERSLERKAAIELIETFNAAGYSPYEGYWLDYAYGRFGQLVTASDVCPGPVEKALAVLQYFATTAYEPTTSPTTIARVTYRAAS